MLLLVTSLITTAACAPARPTPPQVALSTCHLEGLPSRTLCGVLDVAEDRANPNGRRIQLRIAVVPAIANVPDPDPVFLLAGGPGNSAIESLGPIVEVALAQVGNTRDLVLVDQRGTGASNPLDCPLEPETPSLADRFRDHWKSPETFRACMAEWDADPRFYTTSIAMQDLDDVRAALGYDKINLWGGSYGTRAALVYLREHEDRVRTVTLDGVAPMSFILPLSLARDAQSALDTLFADCAADASCHQAYPDLQQKWTTLLNGLDAAPAVVRVVHPLTGVPTEITLTREAVANAVKGQLYEPLLATLLPFTIVRAAQGDWAPFVAQNARVEDGYHGLYRGLLYAVACTEDLPFVTHTQLQEAAHGTFPGTAEAFSMESICSVFPRGQLPEGFRNPLQSNVPVLLLSGALDPVTPPSFAEDAARTLPDALSVVIPGAGHGTSVRGCVPSIIEHFIENGTTSALDTSCLEPLARAPFFVSFAGPSP